MARRVVKKYKHDELAEILFHYVDWADHITLFNTAIGSRYLSSRGQLPVPDVFRFKKSYNRPQFTVYEVKVQRSDFLQDIKKGKYKKYFPVSERVYFVVPKGLVKKEEVPEDCGLMVYNEDRKSFTVVKAPKLRKDRIELDHYDYLSIVFSLDDKRKSIRDKRNRILAKENQKITDRINNVTWRKGWSAYHEVWDAYKIFVDKLEKYGIDIKQTDRGF